jgi:hypothetical protein
MTKLRVFFGVALVAFAITAFGRESRKAQEVKKDDGQADAPVVRFLGRAMEVTALAFDADGSLVVSSSAKSICDWDSALNG